MSIHIVQRGRVRRGRTMRRIVIERSHAMLRALHLEGAELSIVLCDDLTIRTLNRDFRRKDRPTDVLSFPQSDPFVWPSEPRRRARPLALGDIVISLDTTARQARERGVSVQHELTWLLAHAILHLVGWDHPDWHRYRRMVAAMDVLCSAQARKKRGQIAKKSATRSRSAASRARRTAL